MSAAPATSATWSEGYVTDVSYTRSFFKELAPAFLDYVCVINGVEPPPGSPLGQGMGAGFTFCELACGNGVTTNMLAASNPSGEFHGIDFMPAHISTARKLAADGKLNNITFHEINFEEAVDKPYPQFDYIVLHGIYSWISMRNRGNILNFIQKNLKSGGVVYVSYNTLPGWASIGPFQNFALEYSRAITGDSVTKVKEAVSFMRTLKEANGRIFQANPYLVNHMDGLDRMPPEYLAHEYLNQDWHPMYVTQAMRDFATAKCDYVGSATLVENHLAYILSDVQRQLALKLPTRDLRELVKDYLLNQRFRRDVYVRGGLKLSPQGRDAILQRMMFALETPAAQVKYQARVPVGQISFDTPVARAITLGLAARPMPLIEITRLPGAENAEAGEIIRSLQALTVTGQIRPVSPSDSASQASARQMRDAVLARVFGPDQLNTVPSDFGTAFVVNPIEQALLQTAEEQEPRAAAEAIQEKMAAQNRRIAQRGRTVDEKAAAVTRIEQLVKAFQDGRKAWLHGLGIGKSA